MDDFGDDFGYLYANVGNQPRFNRANSNNDTDDSSDDDHFLSKIDVNLGEDDVVGDEIETDSEEEDEEEDDFVVVVNNEDFKAKSGGVDGSRGDDEVKEDMDVEVGVNEANLRGNEIDHSGGCGGGNLARLNGVNSQYKYVRQYGSASMGTQRGTESRTVDREEIVCFQPKRSSCGRFEAGSSVLSVGDQGNGFWLPRYRTILDVDIDTLEHKPWTLSGADMTDYFNFGFDEDSWKSYCQSLDQLRHQSSTQTRNQGYGISRSNLAGATKERATEEFAEQEFVAHGPRGISSQELATRQFNRQIGQAIRVEDSSTERQPSMDVKPPRIYDSDVVIEITVEEAEEPSLLKEPDDKLEAEFEMSEKGCEQGKLVPETQTPGDSKAYELKKFSAEENLDCPTPSSDLRRSHEPATVSSGMLEKPCTPTEGLNSESDTQNSGKVDTSSGGNQRALNILNDDANSDRDSTETNPCVAGIDLLSDDHIQSSTTSSYSHSEELNNDDNCDLRKTRSSQRSSPDSVVDRKQVARVDYHRSRVSKRDDAERKGSCHKYPSRVGSSIEERLKHSQKRNFRRHSEMKSHNRDINDYLIDKPKHMHPSRRSRLHHRDEEWRKNSDFIDEELPSYREKNDFLECYDRRSIESQFHAECEGNSHRQDHWGSRDDLNSNARRCDEDRYYSERMKGDRGCREWYLEERESMLGKRKHLFQSPPHSMRKYCPTTHIDRPSKYREYQDGYLNMRSKHVPPVEYRNSDLPVADRYADSPLDGWQRDYADSEIVHQRRSKHFRREAGTFDRGDDFFEHPSSDIKYSRFIRDDHEYHNGQQFPFIHDEEPVFTERWHYSSLSRDDPAVDRIYHRYERNSRHIYSKNRGDVREPYDNRDAYDRETRTYLDQYDYFENRSRVFQSEDMDWQEDALHESEFCNGVFDEMLDSVSGIPRHKWHGVKHKFVSNEMIIRTQSIKDTHDSIGASGKFWDRTSQMQSRAKHERAGLGCRNPVELRNFREKKSSGSVAKPGSGPINDARLQNGRFQKHPKEPQVLDASFSEKAMINESLKLEESRDKPLITTRGDFEEGQIPTETPRTDDLKANKFDSEGLAQKGSLKEQLTHSQKWASLNSSSIYDESRILATLAKMEKRRERFREPILVKNDGDSYPKLQVVKSIETAESIAQRPTRKRQWGGS